MGLRHLTMATEAGDLSAMSLALNHIGLVHIYTGRLEAALDHLRRALTTAERAGDRPCMLHAANNLGWASMRGADHVQAIASYQQALDVGRDIGDRHTADVIIVGNMSAIYREEGDFGRARTCAMHSLRVAVDLWDWLSVADAVAELGTIAAAEGRPDEAQRLLERAVELARELDAPYYLCSWLHRLARLHLGAGHRQVSAYALSVRLQAAARQIDAPSATVLLRKAADRWTEPHEVAALLDAVWQVDRRDEAARTTAADIYRSLYQRAPSVEYRHAYHRLTGETLPPGPPLPELPEWITAERGPDLDTLLRRIDHSRRRPEAA
jgi:tetratricopeptide (TPR) repeat protein